VLTVTQENTQLQPPKSLIFPTPISNNRFQNACQTYGNITSVDIAKRQPVPVNPDNVHPNFYRQRRFLTLVRTTPIISLIHVSHLYNFIDSTLIKYSNALRSFPPKQALCLPNLLSSQAIANARNTTDTHKRFTKPVAIVNGRHRQVISDGVPIIRRDFRVTLADCSLTHLANPSLDRPALTNHTIMGVTYDQQGYQNLQQRNASRLVAFGASPTNTSCKLHRQDEDKYYDHFDMFKTRLTPMPALSLKPTSAPSIEHIPSDPT
jgi:hypothetical protein